MFGILANGLNPCEKMGEEYNCNHVQRSFGHCVVEWEVKNFGYAAHGMKYELKSPSFTVRPSMTSWRMSLSSEQGLCEDLDMLFSLERLDSDSVQSSVWVHFDVSMADQDDAKCKSTRGEHQFNPNDKICLGVPNLHYGHVNVSVYNFNCITLRCQMIIWEGEKRLIRGSSVDSGLKYLSQDMEKLFMKEKFADVTINIGKCAKGIKAHKSILNARTIGLNDSLDGRSVYVSNDLSLQFNATQEVLRYLYTGDISNILHSPSLFVYDCINALSLDELKEHYIADNQKIESNIDVELAGHMWTIENFMDISEKCILSPLIFCNFEDMIFQLSLYPKGINGNDEHLTVIAESVEGKIDGRVWVKVEVFHDSYCRSWKTMNVVKESELFEIQNLDSRQSVSEKLEDGALRICFKACASLGETNFSHAQQVCSVPKLPSEYYFEKLSKDIFSLRKDTRFSDVVLIAQGVEIKAHMCILSARSDRFKSLSVDPNGNKVIFFNNIKPDVLEIVLDYMYSGVFQTFDIDMLLEAYVAAREFRVNYLEQEYSKILRNSISDDNIIKILMTASDQGDYLLKSEALTYLKSNINSIYDKNLRKIEPEKAI